MNSSSRRIVKPLSALLRDSPYVAIATITGDGRVRLVLDPQHLIRGGDRRTRFSKGNA